jgi:hypothetical protein
MYEQKVQLTVNGESSLKTGFGGFVSLIIYLMIASFSVTRFIKMFSNEDPSIFQVEQSLDLQALDSPTFNFEE